MAKILVMVSSIGLGHAARARAYGSMLESYGHDVFFYAPEPGVSYLRAWKLKVIKESIEASSLSVYLEEHWKRTGRALIGLRASMREYKEAHRQGLKLLEKGVLDEYDLIIAEESWEAMTISDKLPGRILWISDFVGYKPFTIKALPAAYAVNRFLLKKYPNFLERYYVGLHDKNTLNWRMKPFGPKAGDVLEQFFKVIGPIPPAHRSEMLKKGEVRKRLRLPEGKLLLIQLGGTNAIPAKINRILRIINEIKEITPVIVSGPRATIKEAYGINLGYQPLLPKYYQAFDCAYTLAGLLTITGLAQAGVPTLLEPLPGHFEQEENVTIASKLWPGLFEKAPADPLLIKSKINKICDQSRRIKVDFSANLERLLKDLNRFISYLN